MSRTFTADSPMSSLLANPAARSLLEATLPGVANSPMTQHITSFPIGVVLEVRGRGTLNEETKAAFLAELARITDDTPITTDDTPVTPPDGYEDDDVPEASAAVALPEDAAANTRAEIVIDGPSHGNPFVDVEVVAHFVSPTGRELRVGGFYDGDGTYRIRLLPSEAGDWSFLTSSNARSLRGLSGGFTVAESAARGPVRVAETFHFRYSNGERYLPVGTTSYAWIHQGEAVEQQTLATLKASPFNKMRMCVFPKSYFYNSNEPELYPYQRREDGTWDTRRFDVRFWHHLERRIEDLGEAGIEADLILFHCYDRWGFANLGTAADDRYVRYAVRRLAAHPNIWWSMANEYDLVWTKKLDDWERLAAVVVEEDHAGHLNSIHNCFGFYDYSKPWITHCSVQRIDVYRTAENTDQWREEWNKPIVIDECAYEGDLDHGWGNITGEEMTRRFWEGAVRGGYTQHGETYYNDEEIIWWAKGGQLRGSSPERIAFLAQIVAESPTGTLDPLQSEWDAPTGGVEGEYLITYFGFNQPRARTVELPEGRFEIDVIDTWNMTIETLDGVHKAGLRVELPARPYMAIRARRVV